MRKHGKARGTMHKRTKIVQKCIETCKNVLKILKNDKNVWNNLKQENSFNNVRKCAQSCCYNPNYP